MIVLTFKCLSYFSFPFVDKGEGVHLNPFIFEYFPVRISVRNLHSVCIHPKQSYISNQKNQKLFVSKWRPKTNCRFAKKSRDQNLKNHFPKGIFQKKKKHEYIYIFEIKFEKKIILCFAKMAAKTSF